MTVGERLSYEDEKISSGTAAEFAGQQFDSLSVMLAEPAECKGDMTPGIDDGEFIRGDIPMTKQTVRAAILSKMQSEKRIPSGTWAPGPEACRWSSR